MLLPGSYFSATEHKNARRWPSVFAVHSSLIRSSPRGQFFVSSGGSSQPCWCSNAMSCWLLGELSRKSVHLCPACLERSISCYYNVIKCMPYDQQDKEVNNSCVVCLCKVRYLSFCLWPAEKRGTCISSHLVEGRGNMFEILMSFCTSLWYSKKKFLNSISLLPNHPNVEVVNSVANEEYN